jgi:tellurite resistance protein
MADISVIIDVLGAKDMEKAARVTQTLQNKVQSLGKQLQKGNITNRDYQRGVQQLIKKNQQHAGGYKNLQKEVQRYAFSLQRQINETKKVDASMELAAQSTQQATRATQQHTATVKGNTGAMATQAMAAQRSSKSMKQFASIGLQQVGYQVSDFTVQVQSGTSALVAFGQQGSQLAGLLFLIPGMFGAIAGAITSIAIPAFTAFGNVIFNLGGDMEKIERSVDRLTSSLSDFEGSSRSVSLSASELAEEFGSAANQAERFFQIQQRFNKLEMVTAIQEANNELSGLFGDVGGITREQAESFDAINQAISRIKENQFDERGISGLSNEDMNRIETLTSFNEDMEDAIASIRSSFSELSDNEISNLIGQFATLRDAEGIDAQIEAANTLADSLVAAAAADGEISDSERERIRLLEESIESMLKFKATQDDSTDSARNLNSQLKIGVDRIREMASGIRSFYSELAAGGLDVRALESKLSALQQGATPAQASGEALRTKLMSSDMTQEIMRTGSAGEQATRLAQIDQMVEQSVRAENLRKKISGLTSGSVGGGGGASGTTQADLFNKSRESLTNLIAKYDEGVAEAKRLRDAQVTVNDAVANGVITQQQGTQVMQDFIASLDQAEGPLQKIGNTMKDAFGNALMSIVDGTKSAKDAFKDMARAVLKQAYELLVIKPLMNSLFGESGGGGFFSSIASAFTGGKANGGVFGQSGEVTAYANGGVVSGAQMFTHQGGYGVMGEAGPEAIMPLKRGKNGKLGVQSEGGQQPVVIHQNFNFSANGDESVKRIIQQEAPKIANYTQQQILDQRRRGGAMKSTFGG